MARGGAIKQVGARVRFDQSSIFFASTYAPLLLSKDYRMISDIVADFGQTLKFILRNIEPPAADHIKRLV